MTRDELAARYRKEMSGVQVSPQLKRKTLDLIEGKEKPVMKKKLSAAVVFAIVLMICAAALAAATRFGMLDFVKRNGTYVPEDAQTYVQPDVLHLENDLVTVHLRELYYDGIVSRMTVDVKPKNDKIMLLGEDMSGEDRWVNMMRFSSGRDESDTRTVMDVYKEGGYEAMYSTSAMLYVGGDETLAGSGDYHLGEDGTLTLYQQREYREIKPQREAKFQLTLFPFVETLDQVDIEGRIDLETTLTLNEVDYNAETYESTEPVDFPSVGVRLDKLTLNVRAQEIHATIDFTVTDKEVYDALEGGLWFEFVDPSSTETEPYFQRLKEGLGGGGSASAVDEEGHYRQSETLGRNELHDTYTLRAYDAWSKTRYETKEVSVEKIK